MPPLCVPFTLCLFLIASVSVSAQPSEDIFQYDDLIASFIDNGQVDSIIYYSEAKADVGRQHNDLELWISARLDASDLLFEKNNDVAWSRHLEATMAGKWREPRDEQEWELLCFLHADRGRSMTRLDKLVQAISAFQEAAALYERFRFPDVDALQTIYKPLGNCYTRLGDNDKALAVFFKALMLNGDHESVAGLYCDLGIAYWNKSDFEAAEKYHRQGLSLPEVSGIKRALLLGALAQTLLDKGQTHQAARNAAESLSLLLVEKPEGRALQYRCYSRRTAGIANLRLGRWGEAERLLKGARADALLAFGKRSRDLGKIDIALADLYCRQGNPGLAIGAANRALSDVLPAFKPFQVEQNPNVASFYEENVIFEALAIKAQAATLYFEKTGHLAWLTLALDCHDLAWQAETRLRKIFQYSTSKLDLQSSARAREESAMQVARLLYEKTGQLTYLEKAFAIAERSKASLLSEAVHNNLIRQQLAGSDPRFSALDVLRQNNSLFEKQMLLDPENPLVPQWRSDADALVARMSILEAEINAAYPNLADQGIIQAKEVAAHLQEGETVVVYFVGVGAIQVFIFQKNKAIIWNTFKNDLTFQVLVGQYLAYFENQNAILNDPSGYLQTAFLLWQKLLPSELANATQLTIVPDGLLNFIPFDALVTTKPEVSTSLRQASYLLRRQEVRYAWSFSVLCQQKNIRSKAKNYALSLAPGFANGQRGLAALLSPPGERPSNSKVLLNNEADLQHFMDAVGDFRILHLSTHAFASVQDGQLPRLELFDQPLFLPNIYALPLQADLVTLSACQTGLGRQQSGEGVMSLARAFAQAGAACVVSSLWSVNDQSTSQMLAGFYRNLEGGNSIGQALRLAKLGYLDNPDVRATMQSPYFWAGLTMVGDDRVVEEGGVGWWLWVMVIGLGLAVWWWRRRQATQ